MNANVKVLLLALLLPGPVFAQGFAGLGTQAESFAVPSPNPIFSFPADHGAHPDYRLEWWYLTANLRGLDGRDYGLQWTLFRTALQPGEAEGWNSPQVWFAHAAVTTEDANFVSERFARGGIGQAGVIAAPFEAWIDEWSLKGPDLDSLFLAATGYDFGYQMSLKATGPLIFHGNKGYSVKSAEGQASYYYSQPFYEIAGTLQLHDEAIEVTGDAWLDHEWSSQPLSNNQNGWDWFSLSLDDGQKIMGFQLRQTGGDHYNAATIIDEAGTTQSLTNGVFHAEPLETNSIAGRDIPVVWRISLPEQNIDVTVRALNRNSWMDVSIPYWEGPVVVSGSHSGRGYLEMTGYQPPDKQ